MDGFETGQWGECNTRMGEGRNTAWNGIGT